MAVFSSTPLQFGLLADLVCEEIFRQREAKLSASKATESVEGQDESR